MQNKKLYVILVVVVVVAGSAAFVGGRLLNGGVSPLRLFSLGRPGYGAVIENVTPAPELPTTPADATGRFVERQDNVIIIESISLKAGSGGVVPGPVGSGDDNSGPKVEVVVTSETAIYRDATQAPAPSELGEDQITSIQQAAEEATLDDISSGSVVTVWGRKNGDRIIAQVLFFFAPVKSKPDSK